MFPPDESDPRDLRRGGRTGPQGSGLSSTPVRGHPHVMIETRRNVVIRDFAIFQLKLLLDAGKDFVLSMLSIGALVIDLLAGGGKRPRVFYSVMKAAEKFDL